MTKQLEQMAIFEITPEEREGIPNHEHLLAVLDRIAAAINQAEARLQILEDAHDGR